MAARRFGAPNEQQQKNANAEYAADSLQQTCDPS
jgi:hypothetical protein